MATSVRDILVKQLDAKLVDELLAAYTDAKHNFYLGGLRLNAVEGGRFCEAAFRLLEQVTTGSYTALGQTLDTDKLIRTLAGIAKGKYPDSIRIHIPRSLRIVYDIRNNRDAAHLADGIDPNLQDSTLVVGVLDWVLAEMVRLYHGVTPDEAQSIIEGLVSRKAPAVEDINGFLKVLRPDLKVSEYALLILYEVGKAGAEYAQIEMWVQPPMRKNLRRAIHRLEHDNAMIHQDGGRYILTRLGILEVEKRKLHYGQ